MDYLTFFVKKTLFMSILLHIFKYNQLINRILETITVILFFYKFFL